MENIINQLVENLKANDAKAVSASLVQKMLTYDMKHPMWKVMANPVHIKAFDFFAKQAA